MDGTRIDKYLWAIRVFKTRSEASDACNGNKVKINGSSAKASKTVRPGDVIEVHKGPVAFVYKVTALLGSRVGAALVPLYAEDLTPQAEKEKLHPPRETIVMQRDRGAGRPTKKDRRQLEDLLESIDLK